MSPVSLPAEGGTVTISAKVTDLDGVQTVHTAISSPEGRADAVTLTPTGASTYSVPLTIGPNFTDAPVNWTIEVWAVDGTGRETSTFTGGVEVAGQPRFDEPPVVWDPAITPVAVPAGAGRSPSRSVPRTCVASPLRRRSSRQPAAAAAIVDLAPVSVDRFEGTYLAPPNNAGAALAYAVMATAADDIGQETTIDAGSFSVAGPAGLGRTLGDQSAAVRHRGRAGRGVDPVHDGRAQYPAAGDSTGRSDHRCRRILVPAGRRVDHPPRGRPADCRHGVFQAVAKRPRLTVQGGDGR